MKCQRKASPCARVLGLEVLGAVLADDLDPGLCEGAELLDVHVLRRRRRSSRFARAPRGCARSSTRTVSADNAENALDSTGLSGPSLREEEVGVAGGAEVEAVDARARRPRAARARRRSGGRACLRAGGRARTPAGTARRRPFAPRSSRGRSTARSRRRRALPPSGRDALGGDALEQAPPAGVQDRERRRAAVHARDRDRQAVGDDREQRQAALVGPEPVALLPAPARERPVDVGGVSLAVHREPRRDRPRAPRRRAAGSRRTLAGSSPVISPRLSDA